MIYEIINYLNKGRDFIILYFGLYLLKKINWIKLNLDIMIKMLLKKLGLNFKYV